MGGLSPDVVTYFLTGDWGKSENRYFLRDGDLRLIWRDVRDEVLAEWVRAHPGSRPFIWWEFDAMAPRLRVGGIGDVFVSGGSLRMGLEQSWTEAWHVELYNGRNTKPANRCFWNADFVEGSFTKVACDPNDPPSFESQAAYLVRLELLLPGERDALPADAFEPEALRDDGDDDGDGESATGSHQST